MSTGVLFFISGGCIATLCYIFRDFPLIQMSLLAFICLFILSCALYKLMEGVRIEVERNRIMLEGERLYSMLVYPNEHGFHPVATGELVSGAYTPTLIQNTAEIAKYIHPPHILHNHIPAIQQQIAPPVPAMLNLNAPSLVERDLIESILDSDATIIFGARGAGKTNVLRHVADKAQGEVWIGDIHGYEGKWIADTVVGSGRDFSAIAELIVNAIKLMHYRARLLAAGEATEEDFQREPILIIIDEILTVVLNLNDDFSENLRMLIAESRKFGIILIVATQGVGVQALGLERHKDLKKSLLMVRLTKDTDGIRRATIQLGDTDPIPANMPPLYIAKRKGTRIVEKVDFTLLEPPLRDDLEISTPGAARSYRTISEAIEGEMRHDTGSYTAAKREEYKPLIRERYDAGEIYIQKYKKPPINS